MKMLPVVWLVLFALSGMTAFAQQPSPPVSPSELAISINGAVNNLAMGLENANRQIKDLADKNAALQKQLDELRPATK